MRPPASYGGQVILKARLRDLGASGDFSAALRSDTAIH
jgi:hypothetical protein